MKFGIDSAAAHFDKIPREKTLSPLLLPSPRIPPLPFPCLPKQPKLLPKHNKRPSDAAAVAAAAVCPKGNTVRQLCIKLPMKRDTDELFKLI